MEFLLRGQRIVRVCLDFTVTLLTEDGAELQLEGELSITTPADHFDLDPADPRSSGQTIALLLHQQIIDARIDDSGQ